MPVRTETTPPDWPVRARAAHVLVIDASAGTASAVQSVLEASGHQVTIATSGASGLGRLDGAAYDLVLLDAGLVDVAADDVLRAARGRRLPVLVMSGTRAPSAQLSEGAAGLAKPFGAMELLARVNALLGS